MGALFGLAGVLAGTMLVVSSPQGLTDGSNRPIVRVQSDEDPAYAKLKASVLVMRGVLGCQKLDVLFGEADVAVIEAFVKGQARNYTREQLQQAWDEVEEQAGKEIDAIYWSPERADICNDVGRAGEELLGVDLPSYD